MAIEYTHSDRPLHIKTGGIILPAVMALFIVYDGVLEGCADITTRIQIITIKINKGYKLVALYSYKDV